MAECDLLSFSKLGCWRYWSKYFGNILPNHRIPFPLRMWLWSIIYLPILKNTYTFQNLSLFSLCPNCMSLVPASAESLREVAAVILCSSERWNNMKETSMRFDFFISFYFVSVHCIWISSPATLLQLSNVSALFQCLTSCKRCFIALYILPPFK